MAKWPQIERRQLQIKCQDQSLDCEGDEGTGTGCPEKQGMPHPCKCPSMDRTLSNRVQWKTSLPTTGELEADDLSGPFQPLQFCEYLCRAAQGVSSCDGDLHTSTIVSVSCFIQVPKALFLQKSCYQALCSGTERPEIEDKRRCQAGSNTMEVHKETAGHAQTKTKPACPQEGMSRLLQVSSSKKKQEDGHARKQGG